MSAERCETCRYWLQRGPASFGVCRRYPPDWENTMPPTLAEQWCGEWAAKVQHWLEREP